MTTRRFLRFGLFGSMLISCLAVTSPAFADMISFKADLSGSNEKPQNDSKAVGTVIATYDTKTKKLAWEGKYSGLTGPVTMAHFHSAQQPDPYNWDGDVVVQLLASKSPFEGSETLADAQAASLIAGQWYVNIHTDAHPSGEIRGLVIKNGYAP